ncbi:MAG: aminoglycoside phosphotransferase family protein [Candidatus Babeliales bacterium]
MNIDKELVHHLIAQQFPQWKDLSIEPIVPGGWDNRTFRLGEHMLIRMPSAAEYAAKVAIEQRWLPFLAPQLSIEMPIPLAMGNPGCGYPWNWSVYSWIEGETVAAARNLDLCKVARDLAHFLKNLQNVEAPAGAPEPGAHNFYRGASLAVYDAQTRQALEILKAKIDTKIIMEIWESALTTKWQDKPVWLHGDIAAGNLLVRDGKLVAVIDWGGMAVGDPACDLALAWTLFKQESRKIFQETVALDPATWARGRAWALWKALIVAASIVKAPADQRQQCWQIIQEIVEDKS